MTRPVLLARRPDVLAVVTRQGGRELGRIDYALGKQHIGDAERAILLARRREVIGTNKMTRNEFVLDVQKQAGRSRTDTYRFLAFAELFGVETLMRVRHTCLDSVRELTALAKLEAEDRNRLIDRAERFERVTAQLAQHKRKHNGRKKRSRR